MRALLCLILLAASSAAASTRFSLAVGTNLGDLAEAPLRWAEMDAKRVHQTLSDFGDVEKTRAKLLVRPQRAALEGALLELKGAIREANARGEHTTLLFYFSGHADLNALHFGLERIEIDALKAALQASGADVVVAVVDACRNDRAPRRANKGAVAAPGFQWPEDRTAGREGFAFLTSAAEGEVAQESDDLQGSLFTNHLLTGLRGAADQDRDGIVTLEEVYLYSHSRTLADTHGRAHAVQHAELQTALGGQGPLALTYPKRAESLLVLDAALEGLVLVVDDRSARVVAELELSGGHDVQLALQPGRYRVQVRRGAAVFAGVVQLATQARVTEDGLERQTRLAVLQKGAAFDPAPLRLALGMGVGTPRVTGFSASPILRAELAARAFGVRFVALADAALSFADNPTSRRTNFEFSARGGALYGVDLSFVEVVAGVNIGALFVWQRGAPVEAERIERVLGKDLRTESVALGPILALDLGIERWWTAGFGTRLHVEPQLFLLPVDGALQPGAAINTNLSVLVSF